VKLLLDQNLSPVLATLLGELGHDAVHVRTLGLSTATYDRIMAEAVAGGRVVVSADTDFGELLARTNSAKPSVVLLRRQEQRRATQIAALIALNLPAVEDDLAAGAIVVFDDDRIRVRHLPMRPTD
jgi:predicted nuclease of predicted toxin-antitoxin system